MRKFKNNLQEEKVTQLELALINAKSSPMKLNEISSKTTARSGRPRTCREAHLADPSLTSGMHWIDPDGQAVGDDPIYVFCDMTSGIFKDVLKLSFPGADPMKKVSRRFLL